MTAPCLSLASVSKHFGKFTAVDDLSFSVPEGTISGFLGPNGAGKTTTLRMVLDIFRPDAGLIHVFDRLSYQQPWERVGYLPEERGLYKKMTAREVLAYFACLKGMSKRDARARADALLEEYGLGEARRRKVEALSKGMAQKVQVLATIAHEPDLVILDEPFSGLDPVNQRVLEDLIRDLRRRGATVIFSTHVMEHAERLCDHIVVLNKGRSVFDGTIGEGRALLPRRLTLETDGNGGIPPGLDAFGEVTTANGADGLRIDVGLTRDAHPHDVLKTCFDSGLALTQFELAEPRLHDLFVHLVGEEAVEEPPA